MQEGGPQQGEGHRRLQGHLQHVRAHTHQREYFSEGLGIEQCNQSLRNITF